MKRTALKPSGPPKRRKPLSAVSAKAAGDRAVRAQIRADAVKRDGRCVLGGRGGCSGPSDAHEILRRSALAGAATDPRFVVMVCRAHHDLDGSDPMLAEQLGIRIVRWVWDQYGDLALLEAQRLRGVANSGGLDRPFWR